MKAVKESVKVFSHDDPSSVEGILVISSDGLPNIVLNHLHCHWRLLVKEWHRHQQMSFQKASSLMNQMHNLSLVPDVQVM